MNLDEYIKESETDSHLHWRLQEGVIQNLLDEAIERLQGTQEALRELVVLHQCEQEGLQSGIPAYDDWMKVLNQAEKILEEAK